MPTCIIDPRTSETATDGSIRLAGGSTRLEGRVEFFTMGQWVRVCSNTWSLTRATVACHQLGFGTARNVYKGTEFGRRSGVISIRLNDCTGYETNLTLCGYSLLESSSSAYQYCHSSNGVAGVKCSGETNVLFKS